MPRPIETLLSLPRVRLFDRVPILETGKLIERYKEVVEYRPKLLKNVLRVSEGSAEQFAADDRGLSTLLEEINSSEYVVTKHSRTIMQGMLSDIYGDGCIFKEFEGEIQPLCEISNPLRQVSKLADTLVDKTKEETIDVARALLIDLPRQDSERPT
jgi:hypothetical protein